MDQPHSIDLQLLGWTKRGPTPALSLVLSVAIVSASTPPGLMPASVISRVVVSSHSCPRERHIFVLIRLWTWTLHNMDFNVDLE